MERTEALDMMGPCGIAPLSWANPTSTQCLESIAPCPGRAMRVAVLFGQGALGEFRRAAREGSRSRPPFNIAQTVCHAPRTKANKRRAVACATPAL